MVTFIIFDVSVLPDAVARIADLAGSSSWNVKLVEPNGGTQAAMKASWPVLRRWEGIALPFLLT